MRGRVLSRGVCLLSCGAMLLVACPSPARAEIGDNYYVPGIAQLRWVARGRVRLPKSHDSIEVPPGAHLVSGDDDTRFQMILERMPADEVDPKLEAELRTDDGVYVSYAFEPAGRTIWDVHRFDADGLLRSIQLRDRLASEPNRAVGWAKKPHFHWHQHVVTWMLRRATREGALVDEATALIFERHGTEIVTTTVASGTTDRSVWQTSESIASRAFTMAVNAVYYPRNRSYDAFRSGDPVASRHVADSVFWYAGGFFVPRSAVAQSSPFTLYAAAFAIVVVLLALAYALRLVLRRRNVYA